MFFPIEPELIRPRPPSEKIDFAYLNMAFACVEALGCDNFNRFSYHDMPLDNGILTTVACTRDPVTGIYNVIANDSVREEAGWYLDIRDCYVDLETERIVSTQTRDKYIGHGRYWNERNNTDPHLFYSHVGKILFIEPDKEYRPPVLNSATSDEELVRMQIWQQELVGTLCGLSFTTRRKAELYRSPV